MPSKYPHAHFHTGEELYEWLTEHQREGESISQTARRLLIERMHSTTGNHAHVVKLETKRTRAATTAGPVAES